MNNKVGIVTDLHLGIKKNNEIILDNQLNFFKKQMVPYLVENNIDTLFFAGDFFDNRSLINIKTKNELYDLFDNELSKFNIFAIVGNHDSYFNSHIKVNSIKFLKKFHNVTLIEKIQKITVKGKEVVFVPWITDNAEFINQISKYTGDLCVGHFDLTGFSFNKIKLSDSGISTNVFDNKFKKIFSGHFHTRSQRIINETEFVYVGSPYQLNRGDIDEERGFIVLNMDDLSYEYINNETSLRYIKLTFPESFTKSKINGNIIDVNVNLSDSYDENKIEKYISKIEVYNPILQPNIIYINDSATSGSFDINSSDIKSANELMKDYVDSLEIENKEKIYNTLIELYNEAKGDL